MWEESPEAIGLAEEFAQLSSPFSNGHLTQPFTSPPRFYLALLDCFRCLGLPDSGGFPYGFIYLCGAFIHKVVEATRRNHPSTSCILLIHKNQYQEKYELA